MIVSIIIPTFSPGDYIIECLNSIDRQSLENSSFEVIVILNGKRDPFYDKLDLMLKGYSFNSRLIYSSVAGVSNARNLGLEKAKGEYICFIDDDDIISENYLEQLKRNVTPDNIVVSNVLTFETTTSLLGEDYLSLAFKRKTDPSSVFLSRKFFSTPWGKIIPKNIIGERRFDVRFYLSEDALFMASISDKVKQIVKTGEDAVYYRRIRSESASRKKYNKYIILQNKLMLIKAYITTYLSNIHGYNLTFFLSRIVATVIRRL